VISKEEATMNTKPQVYSLLKLNQALQGLIERELGQRLFWVKAEIAQFTASKAGHAYLELIEEVEGVKKASMQAIIWSTNLSQLKLKLGHNFSSLLKAGSEIVFLCRIEYHEIFGLKLRISDVDLSYTLGELEKRKQKNIEILKTEGLFQLNKQSIEGLIIQRIALITSSQAAAYQDFQQHLLRNEQGYKFVIDHFESKVQGADSPQTLMAALGKINLENYDAVAFIRGGGSKLDLDAFNDLSLCRAVAQINIPVLTGIGHESDLSILDMIVKSPHSTPTALADYLLDKMQNFENQILETFNHIRRSASQRINLQRLKLERYAEVLAKYPISSIQQKRGIIHHNAGALIRLSAEKINDNEVLLKIFQQRLTHHPLAKLKDVEVQKLNAVQARLAQILDYRLKVQLNNIQRIGEAIKLVKPENTLKRGYSISRVNGKAVKDSHELQIGAVIETTLFKGKVISEIKSIENE
jgi:exodeoxyribonuclease VII large subunit